MNLNLFFLLLLASQVTTRIIGRVLGKKSNHTSLNNCNPIVRNYFKHFDHGNNKRYPAKFTDPEVKKFCPTLDETCCGSKQLEKQLADFQLAHLKIKDQLDFIDYLINILIDKGVHPVDPELDEQDSEEESSEETEKQINSVELENKLLSKLLFTLKQLKSKSGKLNYAISSFYSGFVCELCTSYGSYYFTEYNRKKDRDVPTIVMTLESFVKSGEMIYEQINFYKHLGNVFNVYKKILKIHGTSIDLYISDKTETSVMLESASKYAERFTTVNKLYSGKFRAKEFNIFEPFGQLLVFKTSSSLLNSLNEYIFNRFQTKKYEPISSQNENNEIQFILLTEEGLKYWKNSSIEIDDKGFSYTTNQYPENLWNSELSDFSSMLLKE